MIKCENILAAAFLSVLFLGGCTPANNVSQNEATDRLEKLVAAETPKAPSLVQNPALATPESYSAAVMQPEAIVREYLGLLQNDRAAEAEKHLSKVSALNFRQAGMTLQSPGSEAAKYEILKPKFATNQQRIAMVDCKITDVVDGEAQTSDISWIMKRDEEYWRITGMAMVVDESGKRRLMSFENLDDIHFIKSNIFAPDAASVAETNGSGTTKQ
jgi:hypothetical protein